MTKRDKSGFCSVRVSEKRDPFCLPQKTKRNEVKTMSEQNRIISKMVTRPRLANLLIESGYSPEIVRNPYNPQLNAWIFKLDSKGLSILDTFYKSVKGGDRA